MTEPYGVAEITIAAPDSAEPKAVTLIREPEFANFGITEYSIV